MEAVTTKAEALKTLETIIESCQEGKSGEWDCSTDEGKGGFDDMALALIEVAGYLRQAKVQK